MPSWHRPRRPPAENELGMGLGRLRVRVPLVVHVVSGSMQYRVPSHSPARPPAVCLPFAPVCLHAGMQLLLELPGLLLLLRYLPSWRHHSTCYLLRSRNIVTKGNQGIQPHYLEQPLPVAPDECTGKSPARVQPNYPEQPLLVSRSECTGNSLPGSSRVISRYERTGTPPQGCSQLP